DGARLDGRQRSQRAAEKLGVSRSVEQVDESAAMLEMADRDVERVAEPPLLLGEVADGGAFFDAAGAADRSGGGEQGFDEGRLAGSGVTEHGDVADVRGRVRTRHTSHVTPPLSCRSVRVRRFEAYGQCLC